MLGLDFNDFLTAACIGYYLFYISFCKDPIMQLGWKTGAIIPELEVYATIVWELSKEVHA